VAWHTVDNHNLGSSNESRKHGTGKTENIWIKLQTIKSESKNLKAVTKIHFLNHIDIKGNGCRRTLVPSFDQLKLFDIISDCQIKIQQRIQIYPWEKSKLRRLLLQPFKAKLTLKEGQYMTSIPLVNDEGLQIEYNELLVSSISDAPVQFRTPIQPANVYSCRHSCENKAFKLDHVSLPVETMD
jgi:hypothetical protein